MARYYGEVRPPVQKGNKKIFYFRYDGVEFQLEWDANEDSDACISRLGLSQFDGYRTAAPEWFPSHWPHFFELIEPHTAYEMLGVFQQLYNRGVHNGRAEKVREFKRVLDI